MNLGAACPSGTRASRPQRTEGPGPEARLIVHAGGTPASAGRAAPRTRRSRGSGITEVNRRSPVGGRIFVVLSKTSRVRDHLSIGEDDFRNTKTVIGLGDLRQERVRVRRSATSTAPAWAVGTWPVGWEVVIRKRPPSWNQPSDPCVALICSHRERSRTNRTRIPCRGWWFAPFHNRYTRTSEPDRATGGAPHEEATGAHRLPLPREQVLEAFNDPEILGRCPRRHHDPEVRNGLLLPLCGSDHPAAPAGGDGQERASEE